MHITLSDVGAKAKYHEYRMEINGAYHSTVRYSELRDLHNDLVKQYGKGDLEKFPPKCLLKVTPKQARERIQMLQAWIQQISGQPAMTRFEIVQTFLKKSLKSEVTRDVESVELDVCLVDGTVYSVQSTSTDPTDIVLEATMHQVGVHPDLTYHFALYLIETDTMTVIRRLQDFEVPYQALSDGTRFMVRTASLTRSVASALETDPVALELLFSEVANNIDRGWMVEVTKDPDTAASLAALRESDDRVEFLHVAAGLKRFGCESFGAATCSYPAAGSICTVRLDESDLVLMDEAQSEFSFEISRLRDCRTETAPNGVELKFEYRFGADGAFAGEVRTVSILSDRTIHLAMRLEQWDSETMRESLQLPIKKPDAPNMVLRGISKVTTAIAKAGNPKPNSTEKQLFILQLDNLDGKEEEIIGSMLEPWDVGDFVETFGHDPTTMDVTIQRVLDGDSDEWSDTTPRYKVVVGSDIDGTFESDGATARTSITDGGRYIVSFGKLHESPMDFKDVARAYTCAKIVRELLSPQGFDVVGYLKRTSRDQHDITAWIASRDLLYPEERTTEVGEVDARLFFAFTPDTLVVFIDCAHADLESMFPAAKPVPVAGDLGITVAPAIRNIASGLPLATIVALADSAGIPDTVFESKKRDDPADEPERFVVPGRTQRDLLFVGTSLSGCVAHTAALMVNVELPPEKGAKGKRPRARSVAFSAPPCFSHGTEPSPRAKELLLHTTTIVAPHDEIFRLLILYQMVGTAREYFGQTLGEDIAEFRRLVHNVYNHDHRSAAKVKQEYESAAGQALVRKMLISAENYSAKSEHRQHLLFPAGGFKVADRGNDVGEYLGLYAALPMDPTEHTHLEEVFTALLSGSLDGTQQAHHGELPWNERRCSRLWDRLIVLEDAPCGDVGGQLVPCIAKVSVMEAPDGMTVSVTGDNLEAIRCQERGRGLVGGGDWLQRPGLVLQNFVPDRTKTPLPQFGEFIVIEASPTKVVFTVVNMQSTTDALAVQIHTSFGESNVFPISSSHITKTRAATGNEILADNTDSRFLNNAFLRILLFVPRDKPEYCVVQRQAECIAWVHDEAFRRRTANANSFLECMMPTPIVSPDYKIVARRSWLVDGPGLPVAGAARGMGAATTTAGDTPNDAERARGLPISASECESIELLQFLSDLEAMSTKHGRLSKEVKRLSAIPREAFESTVKEIDAKVGRNVIRDILSKLDKEQIVFKQNSFGRLFKGAVGALGCAAGGLLAAVGAVVAIPGLMVAMAGYAVQTNDWDGYVDGKVGSMRDRGGIIFGAVGAAGMALPVLVGASGIGLIERARSLFVPRIDNLVSKNYTSSVRIVLLALGGDPDTVRPEVALLEEAVIHRFLDLARMFRDTHTDNVADRAILSCPNGSEAAMNWLLNLQPCRLGGGRQAAKGLPTIEDCLNGWSRLEKERNENGGPSASTQLEEYRINPAFATNACKKLIHQRLYVIARFTELRKFINSNLVLTFVGVHNAGKSELIRRLWGFDTTSDILGRTETVDVFEVDGGEVCASQGGVPTAGRNRVRLSVIDTPGASDERSGVANLWSVFADVSSYFIVVFKAGHIAGPERAVIERLEQLGRPFMVLINIHDKSIEDDLIRCGGGSMDAVRANYAATLQVNEGRIAITDAMDDDKLELVRKRIWHMLAPLISSGDARSGQEARRQLALSLCHADVIQDLQVGLRDTERRVNIGNTAMSILNSPRGKVTADSILAQLEVWARVMDTHLKDTRTDSAQGGVHGGACIDALEEGQRVIGIHLALPLFHVGMHPGVLEAVLDVTQARVQSKRQPWLLNMLSQLDSDTSGALERVPLLSTAALLDEVATTLQEQRHELVAVSATLGVTLDYDPRDQSLLRLIHDIADALGHIVLSFVNRPNIVDAPRLPDVLMDLAIARYVNKAGSATADDFLEATTAGHDAFRALDGSAARNGAGAGLSELVTLITELRSRPVDLSRIMGIADSPNSMLRDSAHHVCPPDDAFGQEHTIMHSREFQLGHRKLTGTLRVLVSSTSPPTNAEYARMFLDYLGGHDTKLKHLLGFVLSKEPELVVCMEVTAPDSDVTTCKFSLQVMLDMVGALLLANPAQFGLRNVSEDPNDPAPRRAMLCPTPHLSVLTPHALQNRYLIMGRLVGIVVSRREVRLNLAFAPTFYKILLGTPLGFADVEVMDKATARRLHQLASLPAREHKSPSPAPGAAASTSTAHTSSLQYTHEADRTLAEMAHDSLASLCAGVENIVDQSTLGALGLHILRYSVEESCSGHSDLVAALLVRGQHCTLQNDLQFEMWTAALLEISTMRRLSSLLYRWTGHTHLPPGGITAVYPPLRVLQVCSTGGSCSVHFHVLENTLVLQMFDSKDDMLHALCNAMGVVQAPIDLDLSFTFVESPSSQGDGEPDNTSAI